MEKIKIKEDLLVGNKSGIKSRPAHIKKHYPNSYEEIIKVDFVETWAEKLYCYVNNLKELPVCKHPNCDNSPKFNKYSDGYRTYCSIGCRNKDERLKSRGKRCPIKNEGIVLKMKKTKFERYGNENYNNRNKAKETSKERYGCEYYNNRAKAKKTNMDRYGVKYYTNREKAKQTSLELYGNEYYRDMNKLKKTNLKKYGVEHYILSDDFKEKSRKTNIKKYGVDRYTKSDEYKEMWYKRTIDKWSKKIGAKKMDYDGVDFTIYDFCDKHNIFKINRYVLRNRYNYDIENVCTICNPVDRQTSIAENEIYEFVFRLDNNAIRGDRTILGGQEIDIYLPNHKFGIEYNGLYWHSTAFVGRNYHLDKTLLCKNKNIKLIQIFEDNWIHNKEIMKSIIRENLKSYDYVVRGDDTTIKIIQNTKLISKFLSQNSIEGYIDAKINIGMFYQNELIKLVSLIYDGCDYEITCNVNKLNRNIINGDGEIINYIVEKYKPQSISIFINNEYCNGSSYEEIGFQRKEQTKPDCWYFKEHEYIRHPKHLFVNGNLNYDNNEIESKKKYMKIFDCGKTKYELILE